MKRLTGSSQREVRSLIMSMDCNWTDGNVEFTASGGSRESAGKEDIVAGSKIAKSLRLVAGVSGIARKRTKAGKPKRKSPLQSKRQALVRKQFVDVLESVSGILQLIDTKLYCYVS